MGGEEQADLVCLLMWYPEKNTVSLMQYSNWECMPEPDHQDTSDKLKMQSTALQEKDTELFRGV